MPLSPPTPTQHVMLQLKRMNNTIQLHQPQYIEAGSIKEFLTNYELWKQKWFWKSPIKQ